MKTLKTLAIALTLGAASAAIPAHAGLVVNGVEPNGLSLNGFRTNGLVVNGIRSRGTATAVGEIVAVSLPTVIVHPCELAGS